MTDPHDDLLEFYYFGFHRTLLRYRRLTFAGWGAAVLGVAGLVFAWGRRDELFAFAVAAGAAVAGLGLVQQAVAAIGQYVRIPFPRPGPGPAPEMVDAAVDESARLMGDIDRGGWQEAFAAIAALESMAGRFGLPPL
ncbi:MAG TPA: hypothetical protein VMM80_10200 [Bacteroidota bacterium]|nr:hypothetical protein [Bacteroidota bacterium]